MFAWRGLCIALIPSAFFPHGNSPVSKICTFSPIYFFNQLFIYIKRAHGYLFYSIGYNPMLVLFATQIVSGFAIGSSFRVNSCVPLTWPHHSLSNSLLSGTIDYLVCFPFPVLESTISPRNPGYFYWKMAFRSGCLSWNLQ